MSGRRQSEPTQIILSEEDYAKFYQQRQERFNEARNKLYESLNEVVIALKRSSRYDEFALTQFAESAGRAIEQFNKKLVEISEFPVKPLP